MDKSTAKETQVGLLTTDKIVCLQCFDLLLGIRVAERRSKNRMNLMKKRY